MMKTSRLSLRGRRGLSLNAMTAEMEGMVSARGFRLRYESKQRESSENRWSPHGRVLVWSQRCCCCWVGTKLSLHGNFQERLDSPAFQHVYQTWRVQLRCRPACRSSDQPSHHQVNCLQLTFRHCQPCGCPEGRRVKSPANAAPQQARWRRKLSTLSPPPAEQRP